METQNNLTQVTQVYDEHLLRHKAGFSVFTEIYTSQHPYPVLASIRRDYVSWIIIASLIFVMSASVIVSGSRTVSEFGGGLLGFIAWIMIEFGIIAYAFFRARRNANPKRLESTVKWATRGLIFTFLIAIAANIDSTLKTHHIAISENILSIINLAVAISAPVLAFISSDVLAIELMSTDIKRREAKQIYDEKCNEWQDGLNRAWNSRGATQYGVKIEIQKPEPVQIPAENTVKSSILQENTRFTPSRKLQQALDYFDLHPEDISTESRKLQDVIGVSHTTINKAQRIKRGQE